MLTYLSEILSGTAEPFWPHCVLISISVVASFAVAAGILLESPKYSAAVHRVAVWLVICGVAVEALCMISLFVFDEAISSAQQSKIIALETQIAPSKIDGPVFVGLLRGAPKAKVELLYVREDPDSYKFGITDILASLRSRLGLPDREAYSACNGRFSICG
jgi:hypothetical protein